jgi:deoxyribonuclease V
MKIPRPPHNWSLTPQQAIAVQKRLAPKVLHARPKGKLSLVAGIDAAFTPDNRYCIGGVVLWDIQRQQVLEQQIAIRPLTFPYVPGLLTFREAPALIAALRKLEHIPDVLICDGQGIAHQRRFGIACHVGIITGLPTVGCAKSRLVGRFRAPGPQRGSISPLFAGNQRIGSVVRTRTDVKPVFVSVGHKVDLACAEQLILACTGRYRLPEPTRLADRLVGSVKKQLVLLRHRNDPEPTWPEAETNG